MNDQCMTVGRSVPRIDAVEKVTGNARFAPDLKMEGMLHARLLRSPHAHARVTGIDTSRAKTLPGVMAIATIEEVPKVINNWFFLRTEKKEKQMFLLDRVVRFVGDPVLAVAAESEDIAEEALSLIRVDYEVLPPIFDPFNAMKEKDIRIHEKGNIAFQVKKTYGDWEQGFRDADIVFENIYKTSKQKHAPIEPIGSCLADYGPNGNLLVYSSTQLPHWSKMYLARALNLSQNKVRLIKPYTGGAFGGRCGLIHGLELMCSWLSRETCRPVRMSFTREEDFTATETRHPMTIAMKTGITRDGLLIANQVDLVANVGGYGTHYIGVIADCLSTGVGLYRCPNVNFNATAVFTNTSLTGAYRGYGNPQMNFAQESQMDMLAEAVGMDPVEFRLKNYRGLGEIDPVLNQEILSDGMKECLEKGVKSFGWKEKRTQGECPGPKKRGAGMAVMLHGTGAAGALPDPASATVMINADGSVELLTAAADEGQGNRTVLAQIAAEVLGIEFEKISVSETDTGITPLDGGTHGSRQTYAGGLAVKKAAQEAREKLLRFAAKELDVADDDLEIREGLIYNRRDRNQSILLGDLMRRVQIGDMSVNEQVMGMSTGIAEAMPGYYGANFAEVEVDTETGEVRVLKLTGAFDVGRAINPSMVEGQITGGGVMGLGWALTEELMLSDGRILNNSFRDYRLLRAGDIPELDTIIVESHEPTGPYGAKGIGEGCLVCVASSIANAIYDAIGVRMKDLCITQEKILKGLEDQSQGS